jgi:hypothetical protein
MQPRASCLAFSLLALCPVFAQTKFTAAEYARAEKFMGYNTNPLVARSGVRPNWLPDERFWYRMTTAAGRFGLVDPEGHTRTGLDHAGVPRLHRFGAPHAAGQLAFQETSFRPTASRLASGRRPLAMRRSGREVYSRSAAPARRARGRWGAGVADAVAPGPRVLPARARRLR